MWTPRDTNIGLCVSMYSCSCVVCNTNTIRICIHNTAWMMVSFICSKFILFVFRSSLSFYKNVFNFYFYLVEFSLRNTKQKNWQALGWKEREDFISFEGQLWQDCSFGNSKKQNYFYCFYYLSFFYPKQMINTWLYRVFF